MQLVSVAPLKGHFNKYTEKFQLENTEQTLQNKTVANQREKAANFYSTKKIK